MYINSASDNIHNRINTVPEQKQPDRGKEKYQSVSKGMDIFERSPEEYELCNYNKTEKISATSGKDVLEITRGDKGNNFVIHFWDSAMVSRAVSRGYITVNGVHIELSEEMKQRLTDIDRQAESDREKSYYEYIMRHDMAVAKQQGEALNEAYGDMSDAFRIVAKIIKGGKVSGSEIRKLMEINPGLYAMAMTLAAMSGKKAEQGGRGSVNKEKSENASDETAQGVSWSDFEWKSYETKMTVSMEGTPAIESVAVGELSLS